MITASTRVTFPGGGFSGESTVESRIVENGSYERYRLGKSLRKKGLDSGRFFETLDEISNNVYEQLLIWSKDPIEITVTPLESFLTDHREWKCHLADGLAKIYCGGTHSRKITPDEIAQIKISLRKESNEPECVMTIENSMAVTI